MKRKYIQFGEYPVDEVNIFEKDDLTGQPIIENEYQLDAVINCMRKVFEEDRGVAHYRPTCRVTEYSAEELVLQDTNQRAGNEPSIIDVENERPFEPNYTLFNWAVEKYLKSHYLMSKEVGVAGKSIDLIKSSEEYVKLPISHKVCVRFFKHNFKNVWGNRLNEVGYYIYNGRAYIRFYK